MLDKTRLCSNCFVTKLRSFISVFTRHLAQARTLAESGTKETKMPVARAETITLVIIRAVRALDMSDKMIGDNNDDIMTQVHFNDVYNVESRGVEPVGGAARFLTAVRSATCDTEPLILFSGDIFAPSISKLGTPGTRDPVTKPLLVLPVSTFTKGDQMVPVLNQLGVHCAVYGNHDFGKNIYGVRIKIS